VKLYQLISLLADAHVIGSTELEIANVVYDSRSVQPGSLFVAIRGYHDDGHSYIFNALERGARAIVVDNQYSTPTEITQIHRAFRVTFVRVADSRRTLAPLATTWYRNPSVNLQMVGITGTKGKTTTTMLTSHVLEAGGLSTGMISTVDFKVGAHQYPNTVRQSTPEAPEVQALLREMVNADCAYAVIEASSHALSPAWDRLGYCGFDVAVLTNVTHEHLDYHGTIEQYRQDKARLFAMLGFVPRSLLPEIPIPMHAEKRDKYAIVNADDPHHQLFLDAAPATAHRLTYAISAAADVRATNIEATPAGSHMRVITPWGEGELHLNLPGRFNIQNSLAALSVALCQGVPLAQACQALGEVQGVRGRMERVNQGQPFEVIADYAHNPDSFTQVMEMLRPMTTGRLIAVFGSAGERDIAKRALQGAIAAQYCDMIFLTDEDPRGEDRHAILADIARGIEQQGKREGDDYQLIPDRAAALRAAFGYAQAGDVVVLLGKGHEGSIEYADKKLPWNEVAEAQIALREMGY
jgi:UDP-N-acetylmuramoyl-L-alanyl-D-glutamate--2,6-diaminopimelate ligase